MSFFLFSSLTFSSFLRAINECVQYCKIVLVVNNLTVQSLGSSSPCSFRGSLCSKILLFVSG